MDDMIIIINVDYIRRRMEGRAIPSDVLFHSSHPRPRVPGIGFLTSVPNRVWDAMGSPCLTYLASYSLVVAQDDLPFEPCVCWFRGQQFSKHPGPVGT